MGQFQTIRSSAISSSLADTTRQYLVGNLKRPQQLAFIRDTRVEIGITAYREFAAESAHRHTIATEFQYVLAGWTQYLDLDTGEIFEFKKGDFFAILPHTAYAQKSKKGTEILFIKVPSINDKELAEMSSDIAAWLKTRLQTVRTDYYHRADAPAANSIRPAAAAAILNERQEILLLQRADSGNWTMPGGTMEFGESLTQCVLREVEEETGLKVRLTDVIGTYTDPDVRIAYSDGEVRQEFTLLYKGECLSGRVRLDEESTAWNWFPLHETDQLPMADSQRKRLMDVIAFLHSGSRRLT